MYMAQVRTIHCIPNNGFLPSENLRAMNLRVSSIKMTGIEIFSTATHSSTLSGVIWKMTCRHRHQAYDKLWPSYIYIYTHTHTQFRWRPMYRHMTPQIRESQTSKCKPIQLTDMTSTYRMEKWNTTDRWTATHAWWDRHRPSKPNRS